MLSSGVAFGAKCNVQLSNPSKQIPALKQELAKTFDDAAVGLANRNIVTVLTGDELKIAQALEKVGGKGSLGISADQNGNIPKVDFFLI